MAVRILTGLLVVAGSLAAAAGQAPAPDAGGGGASLSAEQAAILRAARLYALAYTSMLPDFICTQVTDRDTSTAKAAIAADGSFGVGGYTQGDQVGHGPSDQIVEKLTYFNRKENYEVVTVNGKKVAGREHAKLTGATSAGEFGSAMSAVFDPHSRTVFRWRRPASMHGRHAFVFEFQVPKEAGIRVSAGSSGSSAEAILAPYHGLVFVDAETKEVLRITTEFDLPKGFPIQEASRIVDYRPTVVAGKRYVLPFHSEVKMESGAQTFLNKIEFKDYHKFAVESTLQFGGPEEAGAAPIPAPTSPAAASAVANAGAAAVAEEAAAKAEDEGSGVAAPASAIPAPAAPIANSASTSGVAGTASGAGGAAGSTASAGPAGAKPDAPAESTFTLRLNADLVLVPVVVRDRNGNPVAHLTRDNFQVFDKGKRQEIVDFAVVGTGEGGGERDARGTGAGAQGGGAAASGGGPGASPGGQASTSQVTTNYIVYLFDDLHMKAEDMARAKEAVVRSLDALTADDRAAIIATSGQVTTPLTTDRERLKEGVGRLRVQPGEGGGGCPAISYYMANEIVSETGGSESMAVATAETMECMNLPGKQAAQAANMALRTAQNVAAVGERQSRGSLLQMREVVRWLAKAPGNRRILLVSPGFVLNQVALMDSGAIVDEAIREQVVISALDVRGVHGADTGGGVDEKSYDARASRDKAALASQEITATEGTMGGIAEGTGGTFVRNTNDLNGGLRRLVAAPVCTYVLGFRPGHLKPDGGYHALEVKVEGGEKVVVQARAGYFAAKQ